MSDYPAEPWELRGQLHASAFVVPLRDVPVDLPPGCSPIRIGRRAIIGTAWVEYEPGGVLDYRELMATLLVRRGWRIMPTIVKIWVDSEPSRDGGRALWGIPKDLASFSFDSSSVDGARLSAWDDDGEIAAATVRARVPLPRRWPVAFSVVQWLDGAPKISPVRAKAAGALTSVTFEANPTGPLGFLAGHRPWVSFSLRDFRMSFGRG